MLEPRQMNEDGLDVREANHRMMNMLAILLALFHRNFSKFSDQCVRGAVTKFENQIMAASELLRTISSTPNGRGCRRRRLPCDDPSRFIWAIERGKTNKFL